jgi:hypothetical protein
MHHTSFMRLLLLNLPLMFAVGTSRNTNIQHLSLSFESRTHAGEVHVTIQQNNDNKTTTTKLVLDLILYTPLSSSQTSLRISTDFLSSTV